MTPFCLKQLFPLLNQEPVEELLVLKSLLLGVVCAFQLVQELLDLQIEINDVKTLAFKLIFVVFLHVVQEVPVLLVLIQGQLVVELQIEKLL